MALSDYERRVLSEIETELAMPGPGRVARCRAGVRRLRFPLLVTVFGLALLVVVGLYALPSVALGVAAATAFVLGFVWGARNRFRLLR